MTKKQSKRSATYTKWTEAEDQELIRLRAMGYGNSTIYKKLGCTESASRSRWQRLCKAEPELKDLESYTFNDNEQVYGIITGRTTVELVAEDLGKTEKDVIEQVGVLKIIGFLPRSLESKNTLCFDCPNQAFIRCSWILDKILPKGTKAKNGTFVYQCRNYANALREETKYGF